MAAEATGGAAAPPKDVELSDQTGEKEGSEHGFEKSKSEKQVLPDFFPSHGLTTAGEDQV